MATYERPDHVVQRCEALKQLWAQRNRNIVSWYDLLTLNDKLKQTNMESVVANDPRTFYNAALHLLTPNIPHRIPVQGLDKESIAWSSSLERVIRTTWASIDRQYRRRGRKSWMEYVVGLLLATGWYSILAMATRDKLIAEAWNPMEVFPDWDSQGMYTVAHVFTLDAKQATRLFHQRNWDIPHPLLNRKVTIYDLWDTTNDGIINVTTVEQHFVKPETLEPFEEIPVLAGPAGGLPDDGPIQAERRTARDQEWRANVGQSILATNAGLYLNNNRMVTFMQQILRDTAQPKYWEKTRSNTILTPESLEQRGAIFRLGEGDDIGTVTMPGIPVELTALINSYQQMIQRGSLPNALSGEVRNIPIGLMSQVAAAAVQTLSLYHTTITNILTDIDNIWVDGMMGGVFEAETLTLPQNIPADILRFDIQYPISIPGDLVQRATITRMISPSARISATSALDLFFPEIQDPQQELAMARADDAQQHPVFAMLNLISALREEAKLLRLGGNNDDADLLDRAQEVLIAQITQGGEAQPGADGRGPGGIPPRGLSPDVQAMLQQAGVQLGGQQGQ